MLQEHEDDLQQQDSGARDSEPWRIDMRIEFTSKDVRQIETVNLVIFTPEYDELSEFRLRQLDQASGGALETMLESSEFVGREGQIVTLHSPEEFAARRVILVGLGEKDRMDEDTWRRVCGRLSRYSGLKAYKEAAFYLGDLDEPSAWQAIIEGYVLGGYKLTAFKGESETREKGNGLLDKIIFAVDDKGVITKARNAVQRGLVAAEGQLLVRRLAATPGNLMSPDELAKEAQKLARQEDIDVSIMDEKGLEKEKMGLLLAVGQGSANAPRLVTLTYSGGTKTRKPIVLVGKGITYDSGGLSLKKPDIMPEMKGDMAGAAIVLATVIAAAKLKLKHNIIGLMPLAENLPSSKSYRPGDIITSRKGKTVEIINTDAEGRLALADALNYADTFNPEAVIDIATLTGGALYVLGYSGAPIMGNSNELMDRLRTASEETGERVWEMPVWDDFRNRMKSDIADLKNSGGKPAATMTAGAFLENFIGDWPWAHVDVAYVDVEPSGRPYIPKGTTGIGMRLLLQVLSNWTKL
jgi:leucyl aminopeptidase